MGKEYTKEELVRLATGMEQSREVREIAANMLYILGQRDQSRENLLKKMEEPV